MIRPWLYRQRLWIRAIPRRQIHHLQDLKGSYYVYHCFTIHYCHELKEKLPSLHFPPLHTSLQLHSQLNAHEARLETP